MPEEELKSFSSDMLSEHIPQIDTRLSAVNDLVNIIRRGGAWDVRQAIFDLEQYFDIAEATAAVMAAMQDTRYRVRYAASLMLSSVDSPEVEAILLKSRDEDPDEWVRRNCETALRERAESEEGNDECVKKISFDW